jgi:acetylornithine deacetylase/succinyl-diaminopimelate desuccinylase family protein
LDLSREIDFLSRLVEIDTDSNLKTGYVACADVIRKEAESIGLRTEVYDSVEVAQDKKPRPNVIARLDVGARETVLLATHYDVVAAGTGWRHDPFKLVVEGDKAFGRGAADDKGAIVCAMSALRELKERTPRANTVLLACPDEEVGGELGLGYAVNHANVRGDAAIVIDASPAVVSIGASGILWGKIVVKGKQGHAGYPQLAKNAIDEAIPFLERLSKYAKIRERIRSKILAPPGSPHKQIWGRFTLTMLKAGEKENIIPGECEARFDMRVCPDENYERAKKDLERYFKKLRSAQKVKATLEFTQQTPSNYFTDPKHPIVARFARAASQAFGRRIPVAGELGGNDGHFFSKVGIPVISFGPIRDDCRFHGVDEFVYLKDIELVKKTLVNLVCDWETDIA